MNAIKLVRSRTSCMADAMLKVRLHESIGASAVRSDRAVTFGTTKLPFRVLRQGIIDRDWVPPLVRPELAVIDHVLNMRRMESCLQRQIGSRAQR